MWDDSRFTTMIAYDSGEHSIVKASKVCEREALRFSFKTESEGPATGNNR